ncbi:MAG: hypothetical protein WCT02_01530 [Candidatus Paceibacterota bacterium]
MKELRNWLEIGAKSAKKNVSTIICGFAKRKDFSGIAVGDMPEIEVILLNAEPEIVRKRLVGRYSKNGVFDESQKVIGKSVNEFIEGNVWYCKIMEKECIEDGCKIVNTSKLTPEDVSREIVSIIGA